MKPIIGVLPLFDEKKDSYWMLPGYMKGIMNAGGKMDPVKRTR